MELLITESTVAMDNPENIAINVKKKSPKNELSYDDILSNMGMCVKNGNNLIILKYFTNYVKCVYLKDLKSEK